MKLNELYKKQVLDKATFDSGDKVVDLVTDHGDIGTVLSHDGKMYIVKWKDGSTSNRADGEIRLATHDELKAVAGK